MGCSSFWLYDSTGRGLRRNLCTNGSRGCTNCIFPCGDSVSVSPRPRGSGGFLRGGRTSGAPLGSKSSDLAPAPRFSLSTAGGWGTRGFFWGASPPQPPMWEHSSHALRERALRPAPRVTFSPMRKSPKNLPEGATPSGYSPEGDASLPLRRCRHPLDRVSATNPDRFATLGWWANRSLFLPKLHRGSHFLLSIRGSAGLPSRMLEGLSYCNQYR